MSETQTLITDLYAMFNRRDIDGALALMHTDVSWPKASEGGRVVGKDEVRAYWTRQWKEFDPQVEPVEIMDSSPASTGVRVHQVVRSLAGDVLFDGEVLHLYTITQGLIVRMELGNTEASGAEPSTAFARH